MEKLTAEFRKRIETKIEELEAHTSVEFVPVITERSATYRQWKVIYGLLAFSVVLIFLVSGSGLISNLGFDWLLTSHEVLAAAFVALLFLLLLIWLPAFRFLLPASVMRHEVEEEAHRVFLLEEIFATENRTGVLILISEFEHAVYILADKGLLQKVPAGEWAELGSVLAKDFSKRSEGETFLMALEALAKRLSPEFPPKPGNPNELSNRVRRAE